MTGKDEEKSCINCIQKGYNEDTCEAICKISGKVISDSGWCDWWSKEKPVPKPEKKGICDRKCKKWLSCKNVYDRHANYCDEFEPVAEPKKKEINEKFAKCKTCEWESEVCCCYESECDGTSHYKLKQEKCLECNGTGGGFWGDRRHKKWIKVCLTCKGTGLRSGNGENIEVNVNKFKEGMDKMSKDFGLQEKVEGVDEIDEIINRITAIPCKPKPPNGSYIEIMGKEEAKKEIKEIIIKLRLSISREVVGEIIKKFQYKLTHYENTMFEEILEEYKSQITKQEE